MGDKGTEGDDKQKLFPHQFIFGKLYAIPMCFIGQSMKQNMSHTYSFEIFHSGYGVPGIAFYLPDIVESQKT